MDTTQHQPSVRAIVPIGGQKSTGQPLTIGEFEPNRKRKGAVSHEEGQQGGAGGSTPLDVTQAVRGQLSGKAARPHPPQITGTEPPPRGLGTNSEITSRPTQTLSAHAIKNPEKNCGTYTQVQEKSWAELAREGNRLKNAQLEREKHERLTRWAMLSAAGQLRPGEQVAGCMTHPAIREGETMPETVEVVRHGEKLQAKYPKLAPCKSVWDCPVCAAREAVERTQEVRDAGRQHREDGGGVLLVTLTVRHASHKTTKDTDGNPVTVRVSLSETVNKFQKAREWLHRQRAFRTLMGSIGAIGSIRALEVTHGAHGWHPHTHELVFTSASVSDQGEERTTPKGKTYVDVSPLARFRDEYLRQWKRACRRFDLQVTADGLHVRATDQTTTEGEWDAATGYMVDSVEYDTRSPEQRQQDEENAVKRIRFELERQAALEAKRERAAQFLDFAGGWDAASEITAGTRKKARTVAGRTPMQLLSDYALHDDQEAGDLFIEFSLQFKGRRQLVWSDGLKKRFALDEDTKKERKEAQKKEEEEWQMFAEIPRQDWKTVLRAGGSTRGELLHHAAQDDRPQFDHVLEECRTGKRKAAPRSLRFRKRDPSLTE